MTTSRYSTRNSPVRRAAVRVHLDRHPEEIPAFLKQLKARVGAKATEYHQFKYPVAIEDESRLTHPRWASRILAPSLPYMPTGSEPDSEIAGRSLQALRKAGIL